MKQEASWLHEVIVLDNETSPRHLSFTRRQLWLRSNNMIKATKLRKWRKLLN